jgi:hypothetical protein
MGQSDPGSQHQGGLSGACRPRSAIHRLCDTLVLCCPLSRPSADTLGGEPAAGLNPPPIVAHHWGGIARGQSAQGRAISLRDREGHAAAARAPEGPDRNQHKCLVSCRRRTTALSNAFGCCCPARMRLPALSADRVSARFVPTPERLRQGRVPPKAQ